MDHGDTVDQLRAQNKQLRAALKWALPIVDAGLENARDRLRQMVRDCKGDDIEAKLKDVDIYLDKICDESESYRKAVAALIGTTDEQET